MKTKRVQFEQIKSVIEMITGGTINMATKAGTSASGAVIKATEAAGSSLHKIILNIGGKLGHKFKPWEAVNLAKNIGNIAKFVGPAVGVIELIISAKQSYDEQKQMEEIQKAQLEYRQNFIDIADDLEAQYGEQIGELLGVYVTVSEQIGESREKVQRLLKSGNEMKKELSIVRNELVEIQKMIF